MECQSEPRLIRFTLSSTIARDQIEYIEKFRNNSRASHQFFGQFIVYNGPLIIRYEEHNKRVCEKIAMEKARLDRLVDEALDNAA